MSSYKNCTLFIVQVFYGHLSENAKCKIWLTHYTNRHANIKAISASFGFCYHLNFCSLLNKSRNTILS